MSTGEPVVSTTSAKMYTRLGRLEFQQLPSESAWKQLSNTEIKTVGFLQKVVLVMQRLKEKLRADGKGENEQTVLLSGLPPAVV